MEPLAEISRYVQIHVITADTFGLARGQLENLPVRLVITPAEEQAETKLRFVQALSGQSAVAIRNGRNDRKMLVEAAPGIALIQREGGAAQTIANAHLVCTSILDALALLKNPKRLVASLRS
ncbi:MAG: hypothetical protein LBU11_12055 [Zoogloeaceae bacterium]|nr:hypothetical protein [Zoogloeaceae bacterium]